MLNVFNSDVVRADFSNLAVCMQVSQGKPSFAVASPSGTLGHVMLVRSTFLLIPRANPMHQEENQLEALHASAQHQHRAYQQGCVAERSWEVSSDYLGAVCVCIPVAVPAR